MVNGHKTVLDLPMKSRHMVVLRPVLNQQPDPDCIASRKKEKSVAFCQLHLFGFKNNGVL
jgi:hypothetical protein